MTFLRIIQCLLDVLVEKVLAENFAWDIFCSADGSQAFLGMTNAIEWLRHFPLRTRIKECDRRASKDLFCRSYFHLCGIEDGSWRTRMIHVNQVRIQLTLIIFEDE